MNLPKATVNSEEIVTAVNRTLDKYYYEVLYQDYVNIYNFHESVRKEEKSSGVMQSEKINLCEINAGLWFKALSSAIYSTTKQIYPHYIILKKFINYIFNSNSNENFGLIDEFFWKLLHFHPPKQEMFDYYWQVMFDKFIILDDKETEDQILFFSLLELITVELKFKTNLSETIKFSSAQDKNYRILNSQLKSFELREDLFDNSSDSSIKKKQIWFRDLSSNEKLKRCLIIFKFVYDILETDFIFWLNSKKLKPSFDGRRPLISYLLWQNVRDIGSITKEVRKIFDFYDLASQAVSLDVRYLEVIEKLVTLTGEVIRCSDRVEGVIYPFVGTKCENFFRELSVILYQNITKCKNISKENKLIVNFKPPWVRLFLCSQLLSLLTGYQCLPELTGVYDILEHIAHTENKSQSFTKPLEITNNSANSNLMQKLKRFKSINAKIRNGKTHLHLACEENDVEKLDAVLSFPELDVNAVDRDGWTALHLAAHRGHADSVEKLLSFCPKSKNAQKPVNTRARGPENITPLMCASSQGHPKICRLLLEHSGSILLEDVNELDQTPLELSNLEEVTEILQYYKSNNVWTLHSHQDINFDPELKETVLALCVEMIQAYFCTHRTWDVYKTLKRSEKNLGDKLRAIDLGLKWDYMRYHRDIKRNIYRLRKLVSKLELVKEFQKLHEIYVRILSFNKNC